MVRHFLVDVGKELLELGGPVAVVQGPDHLAGGHVQRGEQARGAVADVVVAAAFWGSGHHRQDRLEPVERLDLGLLVDAQHDGPLRRVQVQPDDVVELVLRNSGSVGQLRSCSAPVGLQPEGAPDQS